MTIQKPRGRSAEAYANLHAVAQGELDALKYATDLKLQRLQDIHEELARLLEKARGVLGAPSTAERARVTAPQEAET